MSTQQARHAIKTKPADARELPAYPITEAGRYLRIPPATLRSWVIGRPYPTLGGTGHFKPLLKLPGAGYSPLSFNNLVEAHVLHALRTEHGVSIQAVRSALDYAEKALKISRLLLSQELQTGAGDLFLERYGQLLNLSRSGQLAIQRVLQAYLRRVEWDTPNLPLRLFPFVRASANESEKVVAIDPFIAFGRPVVWSRRVSTRVITERIDAGERVEDVAEDYGLGTYEVEGAILYERAA